MNNDECSQYLEVRQGRNASAERPESNLQFTLGFYIFGHLLIFFCAASWFKFKSRFERTNIRPTPLVILAILCSLLQMNYFPLQVLIDDRYPCWVGVVLNTLIIPMGATAVNGRLLFFSFSVQFSKGAYQAYHANESPERDSLITNFHMLRRHKLLLNMVIMFTRTFSRSKEAKTQNELFVLRYLVSRTGTSILALLLVFPFLVLAMVLLATNPMFVRCTNCLVNATMFLTSIGVLAIEVAFGITFWFILSRMNAPDPWGLRAECFYSLMCSIVAFLGLILIGFDTGYVYPYSHQFILTLGIWMFVMEQTLVQLYLGWKYSRGSISNHKSVAIVAIDDNGLNSSVAIESGIPTTTHMEGVGSTLETLDAMLKHKAIRYAFEQYLVAEFAVESLFFLSDVDEWKSQYSNVTASARLARAKRIIKAFVAPGALYSINIPYHAAEPLIRILKSDSALDDIDVNIFQVACDEVRMLLANGAVLRFIATEEYSKALQQQPQSLPATSSAALIRVGSADNMVAPLPSPKKNITKHHV